MEKEECWATFLASGKVTDYLSYRQAADVAADGRGKGSENTGTVNDANGSENKVKHNAGFY